MKDIVSSWSESLANSQKISRSTVFSRVRRERGEHRMSFWLTKEEYEQVTSLISQKYPTKTSIFKMTLDYFCKSERRNDHAKS